MIGVIQFAVSRCVIRLYLLPAARLNHWIALLSGKTWESVTVVPVKMGHKYPLFHIG